MLGLTLGLAPGLSRGQGAAEIDAQQVNQAIREAADFLLRKQNADGSWNDFELQRHPGAMTSLCTLALLNAGVPPGDPKIKAALNELRNDTPQTTYATSLHAMVFCLAEPTNKLLIERDAKWLESTQTTDGGEFKGCWSYGSSGGGDNSNAQFALLALHEAERVGIEINERTWRLAQDYWERSQNEDGSWGYKPSHPGTGSMTCAGIASLVITRDSLSKGNAEIDGDRVKCCSQQSDDGAIERGINWMGRNFTVYSNPGMPSKLHHFYYLYGLERVGRMTNRRLIGAHDWYREGADLLVSTQDRLTGAWFGATIPENDEVLATSLGLLFLSKGRRPVLMAKIKHGPLEDWNHHRGDVANLTLYAEKKWKRELTWQTIDVGGAKTRKDLADLRATLPDIPVLYISGQLAPEFSDEQTQILREYVDRGGFLFFESCCGGKDFEEGVHALVARMFPEPSRRLRLLPAEHLIWNAEEPVPPQFVRPLYGVDVGCRTSIVFCPDGVPDGGGKNSLSCYLELARPGRTRKLPTEIQRQVDASKSIGINILAYATNREVKFKNPASPRAIGDTPQDEFERALLNIAQVKHNGAWEVAPGALINLMLTVRDQVGLRVSTEDHALSLLDESLSDYHMVFMHGRSAFTFSEAERESLRKYIQAGGFLFADAVCGSEAFAESFRAEMKLAFPDRELKSLTPEDSIFSDAFQGFELKSVMRRDPRRRGADGAVSAEPRPVAPELEAIDFEGHYGVVFSKYDLSCALERHESIECTGYTREDAARIGLNVIMYSLYK